jgi:universal stress protein E
MPERPEARRGSKPYRRILVAVRDPSAVSSVMLDKAATIARANGARVELFNAVGLERFTERAQRQLARLAASRRFAKLKVSCHVQVDFPPHEAIIRRAMAQRCDLVLGHVQPHALGARLLLTNTDWELIRHCPVHVLLVKTRAKYNRPAVLAAVDPFHSHAKPASLDMRILETANDLARALRGEAHLFHAYVPTAIVVPTAGGQPLAVDVSPELMQIEERRIRTFIDGLGERAALPGSRRHLIVGDVPSALQSTIRATRARIVVMGAISRYGIRRWLIGSTAERVLDRLSADVLIVKPNGFRSGVPRRSAKPADAARTRA